MRGQLTADRMFMREILQKIGRRLELRGPGRPEKKNVAVHGLKLEIGK